MSAYSRLKATKMTGQRKAFYRKRFPESSCARKKIVDINILVTSRNGDEKFAIYEKSEQTSLENKELEPVQPVQMNYSDKLFSSDEQFR